MSLNGEWDFVADLDPKYHHDPRVYPAPAFADPAADRRHWLKAPVPGVWQKYAERYEIFEGVCWFAREFEVDSPLDGAAARLRFGAVNYLCRIFLNGEELGGHEGGYTEFVVDAAKALRRGANHIAVMVDNRATSIKWPPVLGYFNYGGIHRDVALEIVRGPALDDVNAIGLPAERGGLLTVGGRVLQGAPGASVTVACQGVEARAPVDADGGFRCRLEIPGAEPWSPESPRLYPAVVTLQRGEKALDCVELSCGFRKIETKDGRVHLNGKPIRLKGVCCVYDSPRHGLVMADDQVAADVALMKELGANAVRCHYPMDRRFYDACDRAGLLVWIEPPVYCLHPRDDDRNTPFSDPACSALAEQMIVEMIRSARNHPSVAIYGLGNECNTNNPDAGPFFRRLAERLRREDGTRLVSYAAIYGNVGPLAEIVDVLGVNSYWGWYDKIFVRKATAPDEDNSRNGPDAGVEPIDLTPMRKMLDEVLATTCGRTALLLTEVGADALAGLRCRKRRLWSEDYQADLLREVLALAEDYPAIAGTFPFCFCDYRDPSKVVGEYWNELNLKGLVSYDRRKKLAFNALQACYGAKRRQ